MLSAGATSTGGTVTPVLPAPSFTPSTRAVVAAAAAAAAAATGPGPACEARLPPGGPTTRNALPKELGPGPVGKAALRHILRVTPGSDPGGPARSNSGRARLDPAAPGGSEDARGTTASPASVLVGEEPKAETTTAEAFGRRVRDLGLSPCLSCIMFLAMQTTAVGPKHVAEGANMAHRATELVHPKKVTRAAGNRRHVTGPSPPGQR